jgi:ribosome maturation factor RimP
VGKKDNYINRTKGYVEEILKDTDLELVDIEFVKELKDYYLRVYIDKKSGVSIDDCEMVSRAMNEILDREDFIDEAYIFEVSSSGDRPFKRDNDFERNLMTPVDIRLYKPIDGKKELSGILIKYDDKVITISINDINMDIERSNISLARKAF